jgi:cyclophilin family peptidyl-prolyl cis-trans isomerase
MRLFLFLFLIQLPVFAGQNPRVTITTSMGEIELELFQDKAPVTVENFLKYVDDQFYDGTIFHRVINNFMIQGGGMDEKMQEKKTRAPIKNEATNMLKNESATVAMARTSDPHSATAQFFINVNDNEFLNQAGQGEGKWGYAVFGKVSSGMHVVNRIKMVRTGSLQGHQNVPMDPVVIKTIRRKK